MRPVASRNFLNRARGGKVHRDHRRGYHTSRVSHVERYRAEMARPAAGRHSNRAGRFLVLFSDRYLHRCEHCVEFALIAVLDLPALKAMRGRIALQNPREIDRSLFSFA